MAVKPPRQPSRSSSASACEPYLEVVEAQLAKGRNAMAIWRTWWTVTFYYRNSTIVLG